jgi:hypothetical protein
MSIRPSDEYDHFAGPSSAWSETWEFRGTSADLDLGVVAAVVRRPSVARMSYWAAVIGRSRPTIALVEHDIAAPRIGLEIRGSGIWADHMCESPHEHWSLGLEAFALALDDPLDLVTTTRGLPVPLGFDLEWEAASAPVELPSAADDGYLGVGVIRGEVLIGETTVEIDGPGHRVHRWGTGSAFPAWWATGDHAGPGDPPWTLTELCRAFVADTLGTVTEVRLGEVLDDDGLGTPAWTSSHHAELPC